MVATQMYTLFEHAVGYALFRVKEYEEIASQIPKVEKASVDYINFKNMVQLVAFQAHKSGNSALENTMSISDGEIHSDLSLFLETNLPKSTKKCQIILGVSDPKIGTGIQEQFSVTCQHTDITPEILRGIRLHIEKLVDGLNNHTVGSSEAGLARSFSRSKVKFNINRADNMIIQSISLLDQLDKDINTFSMRLREWYSYHFPELVKLVPDNYMFAQVVQVIGDRKQIDEDDVLPKLVQTLNDESISNSIISAAKTSMGMDISPVDLMNIASFSKKVISLAEYRHQLMEYLQSRMHNVAPNLSALIGETVGARLISHAGSLINLAKYPASTVQILGAEKALFRALKTRGNTPKHGLLFHSSYISRAGPRNKGRISRFLANKCSIASRIDCFAEKPLEVFGSHLKEQVEERLSFYETGAIPKKNLEVMKEAGEKAAQILQDKAERKKAKALRKKQKKQAKLEAQGNQEAGENDENNENEETMITETSVADESLAANDGMNESGKKNKKKRKRSMSENADVDKNGDLASQDDTNNIDEDATASAKKKKKKKPKKMQADN